MTVEELEKDLQTISGLNIEESKKAAKYIFDNVVNDGCDILECATRDQWIEYLEIGLDFTDE